jgi:hypothetical protein
MPGVDDDACQRGGEDDGDDKFLLACVLMHIVHGMKDG